jgi:ribosomal protein L11 methyltransferase
MRAANPTVSGEPPRQPYEQLFIYYLQGRLKGLAMPPRGDFIGNWEEDGDTFLFFTTPADGVVEQLLARQPGVVLVDRYQMTYDAWQGGRWEQIETPHLVIRSPWAASLPGGDPRLTIQLDPGVVFGNGLHSTTRDCLEALERLLGEHLPEIVLDLGTGTGILALAALRLGIPRGLAVDLNRLAVETARDNVRRNGLQARLAVLQGRAEELLACRADLVIANLHYAAMAGLLRADGWRGKRYCILSGLLRSEAGPVAADLRAAGFAVVEHWVCDGIWNTFLGRRQP